MFNFIKAFPRHYQDCFEKPELLKQYLKEFDFVQAVVKLLYESQTVYFCGNTESMVEFLLEYREDFLRALERFEQQKVPLEYYIGFLLKAYRKNFSKIKKNQQEKDNKIYTNYSQTILEQRSVNHYLGDSQKEFDSYVAETSACSYFDVPPLNLGEDILDIAHIVVERQSKRAKKKMKLYKVLRILLLCNESDIETNDLNNLLFRAKLLSEDYQLLLKKRETILGEYRTRQNEVERKLQQCYLNYIAEQRAFKKQQDYEKVDEQVIQRHHYEQQRLYQLWNRAQFRYLHRRCALTCRQVSELTGIAEAELRMYYRNLKSYHWS